jgi:feruloyl esterase
MRRLIRVGVGAVLALVAIAPPPALAASCEELRALTLPNTDVTLAALVGAGTFVPPATGRGRGAATPFTDVPAFCRVAATLKPAAASTIRIEVWMPAAGWNGKFEALGGQGWAGTIGYGAMREALKRGYAVSATDSGHAGGDAAFALERAALEDFAYRSVHEMAVKAKTFVNAFYGTAPRFSYFDGCSTGGRMALTEAQRFPDDFDGIIAGAPANFTSHQAAHMMSIALAVHKDAANYIPPAKYSIIHGAVLEACDAGDGVKDGVLESPLSCRFDPQVLQCTGEDGPACLTAAQVASARQIYAPVLSPRTKQVIFPGLAPGSELGWGLLAGPQPLAFPREIYQYIVVQNPEWDYKTLDLDADVARAEKAHGGIMDAVDPDLSAFFKRGGKLLQYHGWNDQAVAPANSVNYYQSVVDRLGGPSRVQSSYRLFMVPGMAHCGGGDGTSTFDALAALERWVERAEAPSQIPASRVANGVVNRTRPLCPYPQVARYRGSGSTDEAANFVCSAP